MLSEKEQEFFEELKNVLFEDILQESSLSRIWKHVNDPKTLFAQFSGFRSVYTLEQNVARNKSIGNELRKYGWGYFFLVGYWKENNGDLNREDSIFVTAPANQDGTFFKMITSIAKKYDQDAAIVKRESGEIVLYDTTSTSPQKIMVFKDFRPGKEADIYSKLKGRGGNKTYVFESVELAGGLSTNLAKSGGKVPELDESVHYATYNKDVFPVVVSGEVLEESSLSRLWRQTRIHDYGAITAFRYGEDCGNGRKYTHSENMKRNAALKQKLMSHKELSITEIDGVFIENYTQPNARRVAEKTFFVVDLSDSLNLKSLLVKYGQEFDQDCIIFGSHHDSSAVLVSSNTCKTAFPGFGKIGVVRRLGSAIFGASGEMHSEVKGRPFIFGRKEKIVKVKDDNET